jgi:hypothetical protein
MKAQTKLTKIDQNLAEILTVFNYSKQPEGYQTIRDEIKRF